MKKGILAMAQNKEATKDCIFTALILLMEQKEYKYITVTDIARKAGVSRMTYYRTYSSKEDILVQHFQKSARAMIPDALHGIPAESGQDAGADTGAGNLSKSASEDNARRALCIFFAWFQKNRGLTKLLDDAGLMGLLIECFSVFTEYLFRMLHAQNPEKTKQNYAENFAIGGLFSVLTHHLENGASESPEEMAEITLKIMH